MCAVTVLGTRTAASASGASTPPDSPVSAITGSPKPRARSAARITFAELPLVEIAIRTSPCRPSDSTWRSNIPSVPKSFAIAVRSDVSVVSAIAGIDGRTLSVVSVLTNSVARCWASAALPPLPQIRILPPRAERRHQDRGRGDDVVQARLLDEPDRVGGRAEVATRLLLRGLGVDRHPDPSSDAVVGAHTSSPRNALHPFGTERERRELRPQTFELPAHRCLRGRAAVQQQVAAAARTADLAAGGARRLCHRQHRLDRRVLGDVRVHPSFRDERVAEHRAELVDVSVLDRVAHRVRDLLELLHAEDRVLTTLPVQLDLRVDQAGVAPDEPRVAEHEVVLEAAERLGGRSDGGDQHAQPRELEQVEAAERGGVLILPAAADPQVVAFDRIREAGQLVRVESSFAEHGEAGDHARHERRRAAEAAPGGGVGVDVHLDPARARRPDRSPPWPGPSPRRRRAPRPGGTRRDAPGRGSGRSPDGRRGARS